MIISLDELKDFLGDDATLSDDIYLTYIKTIEPVVIQYVNNWFLDDTVTRSSTTVSCSGNIITDLNAEFITTGFRADDLIFISGSLLNNGFKRIVSLTETAITVTAESGIKTEAAEEEFTISRSNMPEAVKFAISEWIRLLTGSSSNAKNEKIGKYNITYKDNTGGIPDNIKIILTIYKQVNYS